MTRAQIPNFSLIQNNRYVGDNTMSAATNDDITDTPVFI
jgi:hypothetical protein